MKNQNAKVTRYLENLTHDALIDALFFILSQKDKKDMMDSIGFILLQVEDMARMYPEFDARNQQ